MLELLLLRHAKSGLAESGIADMARTLNSRGRLAAQAMGKIIAVKKLVPEVTVCSPALRARETWDIASAEWRQAPALQISDGVYDFGNGSNLLHLLHTMGLTAWRVLIIGHNPSLEGLAARLAGSGDGKLIARMDKKFPTAALAVIRFQVKNWRDIKEKTGKLTHFIRPKDIMADTGED